MLAAKVHATCVYFLTRSYTIHSIGGDWNDFAHENNAPGLTSDSVIGHSLWDYISDPAVMHFYSGAVKAVLNYGKPISIPFRAGLASIHEAAVHPLFKGTLRGHLHHVGNGAAAVDGTAGRHH